MSHFSALVLSQLQLDKSNIVKQILLTLSSFRYIWIFLIPLFNRVTDYILANS